MADEKISEMTPAISLVGDELIPIVQLGDNKSTTPDMIVMNKQDKLTVTAVQTMNYSANIHEYIPCDISGGGFAVTLPDAPADNTVIETKIIKTDSDTVLEVKVQGTDVFNIAGGVTSIYLNLLSTVASFTYNASSGIWYADISTPGSAFAIGFPGVDAQTPITDADISIDTTSRVLTIVPPLGYFYVHVNNNGKNTRIRKTGTITFPAFTDTSGMWYFYFNSSGTAITTQSPWTVEDFATNTPIYRLLWNNTLYNFTITAGNVVEGSTYTNNGQTFTIRQTYTGATTIKTSGTGDPQASGTLTLATGTGDATLTFSAFSVAPRLVAQYIEYHLNNIPSDTHIWMHKQGAIWSTGFVMINNALVSGAPAADGSNCVLALTTGSNIDDNLDYTVTNDATPLSNWQQDLGNTTAASLTAVNSALLTVLRQNAAGLITFRDETRFPFDWSTVTNIPNYITSVGVRTPVSNNYYFVNFIYATQNPEHGKAIKLVSATTEFSTIANARAYNWVDIQNSYPLLNDGEIRPLYRLIHEYKSSYNVGTKYSALRETQDLRKAAVTSTTAATGSLPASSVTVVPSGVITATNAQSALEEISKLMDPIAFDFNDVDQGYTQTYILDIKATRAYTITGVVLQSDSTMDNVEIQIVSTAVTWTGSVTSIDVTASVVETAAIATNTVSAGNQVKLVTSGTDGTPTLIRGKILRTAV